MRGILPGDHGTYIIVAISEIVAQSLLFALFKTFDSIGEQSKIGFFISQKTMIFLHMCATCSEISSYIWAMPGTVPTGPTLRVGEHHG